MTRLRLALWAAVAVAALGFAVLRFGPGKLPDIANLPLAAPIGGAFELTDHTGKRFSSAALAGRPYAVFFGFTQCPDICPTTLTEMTNHLVALGARADRLAVLFVTIDPERDSAQHLAAYLKNFDPRIVGLTGTAEEINTVARQFRAAYEKVPTSSGYTMNHSALVYLMDGAGKLAGTFSFQEPEATQRQKLERLVGK
jgi:protein SCO1/2